MELKKDYKDKCHRRIDMIYVFFENIGYLLFSLIIATPLTVLVWRGLWRSFDYYIFPSETIQETCSADGNINCSVSKSELVQKTHNKRYKIKFMVFFMCGLAFRVIFQVCQRYFENQIIQLYHTKGCFKRACFWLFSYVYMSINTTVSVVLWYGLWQAMNEATFFFQTTAMICPELMFYCEVLILVAVFLMIFQSLSDMIACPLVLQFDGYKEIFGIQSDSHEKQANQTSNWQFIRKLTEFVMITCLSIIGWWSIWSIVDYVGNNDLRRVDVNLKVSSKKHVLWDSMILGCTLCFAAYIIHMALERMEFNAASVRNKGLIKLWTFVGSAGCILYWRGLWSLFDVFTEYLIPKDPENFLLSTAIAILLLILCGCFNTTTSRGHKGFALQSFSSDKPLMYIKIRHPLKNYLMSINSFKTDAETRKFVEMINIDETLDLVGNESIMFLNEENDTH